MTKEDYLEHFGVLGMRWGRRNGKVRLTVGNKKRKAAIDDRSREKIKSNPKLLYKYRKSYTRQELRDSLEMFRLEKELASFAPPNKIEKGKKIMQNLVVIGSQASKLYELANSPAGKAAQNAFKKDK